MKYTSVPSLGLKPNPATVANHYTTADGQSNASTRILCLIMQPLEYFKDPLVILGVDSDAVVADGKGPFVPVALRRDVDDWGCVAAVFESIADQVLHQLDQLRAVTHHNRQFATGDS